MQIEVRDREQSAIDSTGPTSRLKAFFQRIPIPFPLKSRRRVSPRREVATSNLEVISNLLSTMYFKNPTEYIERFKLRVFKRMMLQSPDAKAAMTLKKLSVLADGWEIYDGDQEGGDVQGEFCRHVLNQLPGGFDPVIENTLDALVFGFSLSEKVYQDPYEKGDFRGLIGYDVIRDKPVYDFVINTSDKGEITGFIQNQEESGPVEIPPWKMVYFGYQSSSDNPYGYSDLCPAFQHVFAQTVMDESWPTALKRFAMPVLIAKYSGSKRTKSQKDYLKTVLKQIDEESGILLEGSIESLDYLEQGSSNMAYTAYQRHQDYRSQRIRMSCLVPDLAISEGTRFGSKALGQSQVETFASSVIRQIRRNLAAAINDQIIRPLIDYNFENVDNYPIFAFGSAENEDNVALADVIAMFVEKGIMFVPEDRVWIREKYGMPMLKRVEEANQMIPEPEEEGDDDDPIDVDPESIEEGMNNDA